MGSNVSGNAYALTTLSPIRNARVPGEEIDFADKVRDILQDWNLLPNSPMTQVPQTYLCRYYVLDDVRVESLPGASVLDTWTDILPLVPDRIRRAALPQKDRLQSRYLVFSSNFYCGPEGTPDAYLRGMWNTINAHVHRVWNHCYGFDAVHDADTFVAYMKKCQRDAALFFVGSNDDPLPEQLKALYLKQEFSKFAIANQGLDAATLRANYAAFMARVAPTDLAAPTWAPGQYRL
jgi:hypothetical protein